MSINTEGNMPPEVTEEWNPIWSAVVDLHWLWTFHSGLWGNPQHVKLMQEILPGPLALVRQAFLFSITMGIGRLLDREEKNVKKAVRVNLSLKRLVKLVAQHCSDTLKGKLPGMLADLEIVCRPIDIWRDKRVGHADKEMVLGLGTQRLPDVARETIDTALRMMRNLLAAIHADFNGTDQQMHFPERVCDADALMGYIRDGYEARQADLP
jgi:hypothetical protein